MDPACRYNSKPEQRPEPMVNDTAGASVDLAGLIQHAVTIRSKTPLVVESSPQQWSYILSLPLELANQRPPVVIATRLTVQAGIVGALVVASDMETTLARIPPAAGRGKRSVEITLETPAPGARLVFRNNTAGNRSCVFTIEAIELRQAPAGGLSPASLLPTVVDGEPPRLNISKLSLALNAATHAIRRQGNDGMLDIVDARTLDRRLALSTPLGGMESSRRKSFLDWRMEDDDAPILRYLYRNFRPRRHLEFGTWAGTGTCYCLEECDATVWTINLPEGELIEGKPAYSSAIDDAPDDAVPVQHVDGRPVYQTDAGLLIGRRYREAGFGHRVCQIYCDSRTWDTSAYPRDFFDSVLIDGGHSADVVLSDTRKALEVTRPRALIMWHDFCPDPAVLDTFDSVVGVLSALTEHWDEVTSSLQDVFWVQPSFLLVGIRK
jgi:hypothetical protein